MTKYLMHLNFFNKTFSRIKELIAALRYSTDGNSKDINSADIIRPFIDLEFYKKECLEISNTKIEDLALHYIKHGAALGLNPNNFFDTHFYLEKYDDVSKSNMNPFLHYIIFGRAENRCSLPEHKNHAQNFNKNTQHYFTNDSMPFIVNRPNFIDSSLSSFDSTDVSLKNELKSMHDFLHSTKMHNLFAKACRLEPNIGYPGGDAIALCPPWHDSDYFIFKNCMEILPKKNFDSVVLMPAGRMGGSDLVAAVLAKALIRNDDKVLILRTDDAHWEHSDWYPSDASSYDISNYLKTFADPNRALYLILRKINPKRIYNVNSRRAFETFVVYGARLSIQFKLYAYYFCADKSVNGVEDGYPVWFFANIFPHLTAAITDNTSLKNSFVTRFKLPPNVSKKIHSIYTPAQVSTSEISLAQQQVNTSALRRPCIMWAGRFDRQKRFDLLVAVANLMPEVDFLCWGKAVLDAPPNISNLPNNLKLKGTFSSYDELPLNQCDGFFYTSSWDGLPTVLIDMGAQGMPVCANDVGGVSDLIDNDTGWLFEDSMDSNVAVVALRDMLSKPLVRIERAKALQKRVSAQHNMLNYCRQIATI